MGFNLGFKGLICLNIPCMFQQMHYCRWRRDLGVQSQVLGMPQVSWIC